MLYADEQTGADIFYLFRSLGDNFRSLIFVNDTSLSVADTGDKLSVGQNERLLHVFYRNSNALVNNVTYTTGKHTFKNFTVEALECINASVGNYFD